MSRSLMKSMQRARPMGFTLVELMTAMVISLFLIGGVVLMYASTKAAYSDSDQLARMQENIRFASDYLIRDIRNAGFRDELTLTFIEEIAVESKVAETLEGGTQLIVRYAGRGHCQEDFDEYRVVENRYFLDTGSGELRCVGGALTSLSGYDPAADPGFSLGGDGIALVSGLTDINFEFIMANGDIKTGNYECEHPSNVTPANQCLGVRIGLEFEGLRDMDNPGSLESRFVELTSAFRNAAISQIYASSP